MRHKDTIALYAYWDEIRTKRPAPHRSEIAPQALGALLPSLFMLEPGRSTDMVFRLAGTRVCAYRCTELKGQSFAKLFIDADRRALERILSAVRKTASMAVIETEAKNSDGRSTQCELLLLPLEPGMILGIWSTFTLPFWLGAYPVTSMEMLSMRLMDPDATLTFLQNRPSVPLRKPGGKPKPPEPPALRMIPGSGAETRKRRPFAFRVLDGGRK